MIPIVHIRRRKRRREAREAFTNSPSNAVATPRPPAPRDDEQNVPVRNVEQSDAQDANCSTLETKDAENGWKLGMAGSYH